MMFQKIAKHRANDASNDVHRPPLGGGAQPLLPRWSPFGDFGPHGDQNEFFGPHLVPIYFQSPHFLHFRLKNASKVSAATI